MGQHRNTRLFFFVITSFISTIQSFGVSAFSYPPCCRSELTLTSSINRKGWMQPIHRELSMLSPSLITTIDHSNEENHDSGPQKQFDSNGKEFTEGVLVRVKIPGLKAYHLSPKGCGAFDPETKEFIQSTKGGDRGSKSFTVPVGLRGTVMRVYDINSFDASKPIIVKFMKGENTEEGYVPPITFMMHFDDTEVECV